MRLLVLGVVLLASQAQAYSGQSCSSTTDCSGSQEVCVKGYGSYGSCKAPNTGLQNSSFGTTGRNCTSDAVCSYGEKCQKASKYDAQGKCSK